MVAAAINSLTVSQVERICGRFLVAVKDGTAETTVCSELLYVLYLRRYDERSRDNIRVVVVVVVLGAIFVYTFFHNVFMVFKNI